MRIGAATHTAKSWTVRLTPQGEIDTSNFEGGGYTDRIIGLLDLEFTVEADVDSAANPYDNPLGLAPGTTLSTVKLYLNDTTGPYWSIPSALVISVESKADVKGALTVTFTAKNKGGFSTPTGAI